MSITRSSELQCRIIPPEWQKKIYYRNIVINLTLKEEVVVSHVIYHIIYNMKTPKSYLSKLSTCGMSCKKASESLLLLDNIFNLRAL